MKRKLVRELLLISLPLTFIGGAAWLLAGSGRALLPARFDNGPLRLEISDFKEIQLSPADVYEGFDWAAKTSVQERGTNGSALANLRTIARSGNWGHVQILYRQGKSWKVMSKADAKGWATLRNSVSKDELTLKVKLGTLPANVEEVRLRGNIASTIEYQGVLPAGVKVPANFKKMGTIHSLNIKSKPIDLVIKSPSQPLPAPRVARVPDLEFVASSWYYKPNIHNFLVRLRRLDKTRAWSNLRVFACEVRDADGKKIILLDNAGKPRRNDNFLYVFPNNYPDLSKDEAIFEFVGHELEPAKGWSSVKEPIVLDALVTDGISWPLHIRTKVSQQSGDYKTLAAVPASALTN